ncbi:HAMP domain-containing sensor histidine kinase [Rhabdobacter roseus]|uniref:histidine kinase n=1 Tax=Rhabdobacter roseus TaxID=1655419 RepID=A0A840TTS2_9BACT|nr:HAMP domain-containing sensor histidine kinase [Rhabdobacter roseus]MBB5285067.1 signal transduction histidine kinase [Rhabdobacter roseus]
MTIQNKITLLFTLLTATIILLHSVFIYYFSTQSTFNNFFHRLEVRAQIEAHAALEENENNSSIYYEVKEKHLKNLPSEIHYFINTTPDGTPIGARPKLHLPDSFYNDIQKGGNARHFDGSVFYVGMAIHEPNHNFILVSSAVDVYGLEELENLKRMKIIGFFICILVVYSAGRLFSREIFKPVRQIIKDVKGISAHNLHLRLENGNGKDELSDLSHTFNSMLDRLEVTFEMQNNFVSNASHELRTPLTIISGEAELGVRDPCLSETARNGFATILRESERLEYLISSLLKLAQTGFDGKKQQWGQIRIDEMILLVKKNVDRIMPENQVEINFNQLPTEEESLWVVGNLLLLKAAFANIILNACKYSDNQSKVVVDVFADNKWLNVKVTDQGIGIPDSELPQIFIPFFRGSNTVNYKGHGIGLPLTNNIIRMHDGQIVVRSQEGKGTTVLTQLPIGPQASLSS